MNKNKPILIAGIIMSLTTILHLTGGQIDHVVPLLASNLEPMDKAVLLSVWHMVTVALLIMAIWLIKQGLRPKSQFNETMRLIGWLNISFALVFIIVSLVRWQFAPQWILFLPMGLLVFKGVKSMKTA